MYKHYNKFLITSTYIKTKDIARLLLGF